MFSFKLDWFMIMGMTTRFFSIFIFINIILHCSIFVPSAQARASSPPEYASIDVVPSVTAVTPGEIFTVYIDQKIIPEWHTYWKNPGDSGTPTTVTWDAPKGTVISDLSYPTPERIPFGPLTNFGYQTRAVFTSVLTTPVDFPEKIFTATAHVNWLVCHDICIPEQDSVTITLPIVKTSTPNIAATDIANIVAKTHPIQVEWDAVFSEKNNQFELFATADYPPIFNNLAQNQGIFFPTEWGLMDNAAPQISSADGSEDLKHLPFIITVKRGDRPLPDIKSFRAVIAVPDDQGVIHGFDMMVRNESIAGSFGSITSDIVPSTKKAIVPDPGLPRHNTLLPDSTPLFWPAIFGALLAGLILNLMPCVLPVLFIKILALSKLSGIERTHARAHGLMYAAGVIATFVSLGLILVAVQNLGVHVGWGFQLQSPVIIAALALLFLGITLNLIGLVEVNVTRLIPARLESVSDHSPLGSFLTGILAVAVATPCTVPFMGAALAYGLSQGPMMTLVIFTSMGVGLSLPFVVLTFTPVLMGYLPRPGGWMITFRRVCAVPMFLTALWLLWVFAVQIGVFPSPYVTTQTIQKEQTVGTAIAFSPQNLQDALKTDRPIFVNMTAAWCITCKYNERMALSTTATQKLWADKDVLYMVGDWTNYNADITDYLNQFDRKGVPIYVFYRAPDKDTGKRPDPILLPQLLNEEILRDILKPL